MHLGIQFDILLAMNLWTYKIYVLPISNTESSVYREIESISKDQLKTALVQRYFWCDVVPAVSVKSCLHGAAGMSDLHAWSPLDFAGFGISCREHVYLGNAFTSFEISGFEKDQLS